MIPSAAAQRAWCASSIVAIPVRSAVSVAGVTLARRVGDQQPVEVGDQAGERAVADPLRVEELAPRVAQALPAGARVLRQRRVRARVDEQGGVEELDLERQGADHGMDRLRVVEPPVGARIRGLVDPGDRRERQLVGPRAADQLVAGVTDQRDGLPELEAERFAVSAEIAAS